MTFHRATGTECAKITCDGIAGHERVEPQGDDIIATVEVRCTATVTGWATDGRRPGPPPVYTAADLRDIARHQGWKLRHKTRLQGYVDLCPEHRPTPKPNPTPYGRRPR